MSHDSNGRIPEPRISFTYVRVEADLRDRFDVVVRDGTIQIRGALSAGSSGWQLSARARRFRRTINLYVTARAEHDDMQVGVEDHRYQMDVLDVRPGAYAVRIHHVFHLPNSTDMPTAVTVFERRLVVD